MIDWVAEFIAALAGGLGVVLGMYWDHLTTKFGWHGWHLDDMENDVQESA